MSYQRMVSLYTVLSKNAIKNLGDVDFILLDEILYQPYNFLRDDFKRSLT